MNLIEQHKNEIIALCKSHNVGELYLFGSVLTDKFNENSDIDILIQFTGVDLYHYFENYIDFKESMETLLQRNIDIVENQAIRNPIFRKIIDREKQLIYERKSA
jgi:predicted nucleotidyltransferase